MGLAPFVSLRPLWDDVDSGSTGTPPYRWRTYYRVTCTKRFVPADVIRVDTCDLSVPVVALHRIAAQDAWVATVWRRWRERSAG